MEGRYIICMIYNDKTTENIINKFLGTSTIIYSKVII